jgi:hypothetical protein
MRCEGRYRQPDRVSQTSNLRVTGPESKIEGTILRKTSIVVGRSGRSFLSLGREDVTELALVYGKVQVGQHSVERHSADSKRL